MHWVNLHGRRGARTLATLMAVGALALSPTVRAADGEVELDVVDHKAAFSRRLTYDETFKIAVRLPTGSRATLEYWPRKPAETCDTAYKALTGTLERLDMDGEVKQTADGKIKYRRRWAADRDALVTRLGVAAAADASKPALTKYTFEVERLRVGLNYCFKIHHTKFRELDALQKSAVKAALLEGFKRARAHRADPAHEWKRCDAREREQISEHRSSLKACMIVQELDEVNETLMGLRVQDRQNGEITTLSDVIAQAIRDDDSLRTEFTRDVSGLQVKEGTQAAWTRDRNDLSRLAATTQVPALRAALAPLSGLSAVPEQAGRPAVEAANKTICARDDDDGWKAACTYTAGMIVTLDMVKELETAKAQPSFAALLTEMTLVQQVSGEVATLPISDPKFAVWMPLYLTVDVGAVGVPFAANNFGIAQYVGANFYFGPVDRDERLLWRPTRYYGREFAKRFSLSVGITTTGALLRPERGVTGIAGSQFPMLGGGVRITNLLRFSAGVLLYKQKSQNPADGRESGVRAAPYIALSLDFDVVSQIRRAK